MLMIETQMQGTVTAKTIGMKYQPSYTGYESGVSARHFNKRCRSGGYRVVGGGNGTYITASPSHLILKIEVNGTQCDVWTERDFKRLLDTKRMTPQLRQKIEAVMPESVEVVECEGRRGTKYYVLSDKSAQEWATRVTR